MTLRGLAVLVLLLAAAVAALLWLEKKPEAGKEGAPSGELLVTLAANDVTALEVRRGATAFRLERRSDVGWVLTLPALEEARTEAAESLLRGVLDARARRVLEARVPEADRATYGLDPPEAEVRVFPTGAGASPVTLRLGSTSPVSTDRYVEDDRGRLVVVDASLAGSLDTTPEALAERRLVPAPAMEIVGMRVMRPDGEVRLEREGSGWKMLAPIADRADGSDADAWARLLSGLERSRPLRDTEQARAQAQLAHPRVKIAVTLAGGRALPEVALASEGPLGPGAKDDPERYAGRAARVPGAVAVAGPVPASVLEDLLRPAPSLRDPLIASFDVPAVREVRVRTAGHALTLAQAEGGTWSAREDGKEVKAPDAGAVAGWLDRLRLVRARDYAPPGTALTARYSADVVLRDGTTLTVDVGAEQGQGTPVRTSSRPGVVAWVAAEALPPWPARAAELVTPAAP